jgi:hypothetical protein
VSRGNRFLERALRAAPNVELTVATSLADEAAGFDFVVLDDVLPITWPKGNILAIHVANTNWFDKITELDAPSIVDWRSTHPVLRYVGFDNVPISKSYGVKTPSWGVSLVDSPQASLIVAGELARQRIIWVGFDTLESYWPFRISYPIFVANAVDWLNPASARSSQLLVRAGEPFRLSLSQPVPSADVTLPDGSTRKLNLDPTANEIVFGETYHQGPYKLHAGTNDTVFCVNLLDAAESNIKPRDELELGKFAKVSATTLQRANMELWRSIAVAALLVLLFEWWYYHRRTV